MLVNNSIKLYRISHRFSDRPTLQSADLLRQPGLSYTQVLDSCWRGILF